MCDFASWAMGTLGVMGDYLGTRSQLKAAQGTMNAQSKAAIQEMNYSFQNAEAERMDAFDAAINQLDKNAHNSLALTAGVSNAVSETMSGRTADLIERASTGDTLRTKTSIQDNYERKGDEIDLNKENTLRSTKDYINNLNSSAPKAPSVDSFLVGATGTALNAYTGGQNRRQLRINATGGK